MPDVLRDLAEIEREINSLSPVSASKVRGWMRHESLDVRAASVDIILKHWDRIEPTLEMKETCDAIQDYYRECLIRDVKDSELIPERHIAGYELVLWFRGLWRNESVPRSYLVNLKCMLRDLCLLNDRLKHSILNAVIEHLFEWPEIRDFFAEWKDDAALAEVYASAREWGDAHSR